MPSALPDGEAAPDDGRLPPQVADGVNRRAFGVYLHVPFCAVRCGYCDEQPERDGLYVRQLRACNGRGCGTQLFGEPDERNERRGWDENADVL